MSNIIDKWMKSIDMNEQTGKAIRDLKRANLNSNDKIDKNTEILMQSKSEFKNSQMMILKRLEQQDEILQHLEEQNFLFRKLLETKLAVREEHGEEQLEEEKDLDDGIQELLELQEESRKEMKKVLHLVEDLNSQLIEFQNTTLEEREEERRREFSVVRSYFKAVLWILLILVALFGAYIWGFIGQSSF